MTTAAPDDDPCVTVRRASARILLIPLWMFLAGLGGATLLRWAPGSDFDPRELDGRFSKETVEQIRQSRSDGGLLAYYGQYLAGVASGNLGESRTSQQPVRQLLAARSPVTARLVAWGIALAWLAAGAISAIWLLTGWRPVDTLAMAAATLLLSIPAAVVAIAFLHRQGPAALALALILFPRIYAYMHHSFGHCLQKPHVLLAVAKGLGRPAIAVRHLLPHALPALVSMAGLSVSLGLGAAVPLEVLCDQPGIGHLAWQAAVSRDLPVLVSLTLVVAGITLIANTLADIASDAVSVRLAGGRA